MGKDLFTAAENGDIAKLEALLLNKGKSKTLGALASLRKGPNVNSQDSSGNTPLHLASLNGKREAVELLLQVDASANVPDNQGNYPLHLAAFNGHEEVIKVLLIRGPSRASVNEQNMDGDTALHVGSQYGHSAAVRALLEHHGDARIRNNKQQSPLDLAATYGKVITVQMLFFSNPNVLLDHTHDHSPLHLAARNGHTKVIEFLLERGTSVNEMCASGTPLHEAALFGKTDVVRLLLQRGADVKAKNPSGETVLDLMEKIPSQRSQDITALIYEQSNPMGDPNMRTKSLTFSGKQPNFHPPGVVGGTLPTQQKRPGFPDFLSVNEGLSDQNVQRGASISTMPRDNLKHEYHVLTYPKVEQKATDYSLANVSPVSLSSEKVDMFNYTVNDSFGEMQGGANKENTPLKQPEPDPRHSSPAGFGRIEDESVKPDASSKRAVSMDRAAASYDFVPIRNPKAATAPENSSPPKLSVSNPREPSLNYDIVQPHPRKATLNSDSQSTTIETLTVQTAEGESHEYFRLAAPSQKSASLDSNSSDNYKDLVLEEKKKFDSMGDRYQKLSYSSEPATEAKKEEGEWEEYQGYKLFAPPGLQKSNKNNAEASQPSGSEDPTISEAPTGASRFPPASEERPYHLLEANGGNTVAPPILPRGEEPSAKTETSESGSKGVYCMLGDGWGQTERKAEPPPVYETPPMRIVQKPTKGQTGANSPSRMTLQDQSQSIFYEVPPLRGSPNTQKRNELPVYETPPLRIMPKRQPGSTSPQQGRVSPQSWVTFDQDQPRERPISRALGSSMFYTGASPVTSAAEEASTPAPSQEIQPAPPLDSVPTPVANSNVDSVVSNTVSSEQVSPTPKEEPIVNASEATNRNSIPARVCEEAKGRSSSTLERKVDPFSYVSRKADEGAPSRPESIPESPSPFRTLHQSFNPEAKLPKAVDPTEVYDNVHITNREIKANTNHVPEESTVLETSHTSSATESIEPKVDSKDVHDESLSDTNNKVAPESNVQEETRPSDTPPDSKEVENNSDQVKPDVSQIPSQVRSSIKASGIKQKRSSYARETGTSQQSTDHEKQAALRLSSVPEDNAFNETYEWTKIDRFLESLDFMVAEDVKPGHKIVSQESVEDFLESLGVSQYEATFVANGYDDIKFIGGIIVEDQDLSDIGIQNQEHIKLLREAIAALPEPPQMGSDEFPIPSTVGAWLQKINLPDYEAKFIRCGYDTVDRVRLVWEFELLTVIDVNVTGHRKRMAHSLGNLQRSPQTQPQKSWAEKFKDAEEKKSPGRPVDSFLDDSMDIANQLWQTAEGLAKEMAKRNAEKEEKAEVENQKDSPPPEEVKPAVVAPPRESRIRTVGEQSMTNMMAESPPRNNGTPEKPPAQYKPHFNASWKHKPETLLYEGVRYRTKYLGSHQVTQVRGTASTLEACQKMMGSSKMLDKVPEIQLGISVRGIDYIDMQSQNVISSYDIRNISYCAQHPNDLTIFAYITKDAVTRRHYCHVFRAWSLVQADEIILTIGQCFELAYEQHRLLVESKRSAQHGESGGITVNIPDGTKPSSKGPPPKPAPYAESL